MYDYTLWVHICVITLCEFSARNIVCSEHRVVSNYIPCGFYPETLKWHVPLCCANWTEEAWVKQRVAYGFSSLIVALEICLPLRALEIGNAWTAIRKLCSSLTRKLLKAIASRVDMPRCGFRWHEVTCEKIYAITVKIQLRTREDRQGITSNRLVPDQFSISCYVMPIRVIFLW